EARGRHFKELVAAWSREGRPTPRPDAGAVGPADLSFGPSPFMPAAGTGTGTAAYLGETVTDGTLDFQLRSGGTDSFGSSDFAMAGETAFGDSPFQPGPYASPADAGGPPANES